MNFRLSNIPPMRRWFLGAVVAVVLVVGWVATEPLRTGVRNYYFGSSSLQYLGIPIDQHLPMGNNLFHWSYSGEGTGFLIPQPDISYWEFAAGAHTNLHKLTSGAVHRASYQKMPDFSLPSRFGRVPDLLRIHDGQIVLVRLASDPRTVYAIEAVEQTAGRGHFRSRRISLSAGEGRAGSNALPFAPANR